MTEYNSRTADKFVVRLPDGVRHQVTQQANEQHASMNSWIVQAVEEKLTRAQRQELLLDALELARISADLAATTAPDTVSRHSDHVAGVGKMVEALEAARETLAFALSCSAPGFFENDEDIAQHLTIKLIDEALGQQRTANPSSPSHRP